MRYTVEVNNNGDTYWYKEGTRQLHRIGGPSIEYSNGDKQYNENDLLHRLDGPAVEQTNGVKMYYIHGNRYTEKEFNKEIKRLSNTKNVHKPQIYNYKRPNKDKTMRYTVEVKENGNTLWYKEGTDILHRVGAPAIVEHDGTEIYFFEGNNHNLGGPAYNNPSSRSVWWIHGYEIDVTSDEEFETFLERFYKSSLDKDIKIENKTYRLVEVSEDSK